MWSSLAASSHLRSCTVGGGGATSFQNESLQNPRHGGRPPKTNLALGCKHGVLLKGRRFLRGQRPALHRPRRATVCASACVGIARGALARIGPGAHLVLERRLAGLGERVVVVRVLGRQVPLDQDVGADELRDLVREACAPSPPPFSLCEERVRGTGEGTGERTGQRGAYRGDGGSRPQCSRGP